MKDFFRVLKLYLPPFKTYAFLNVMFNILGVIFSLFSLVLMAPFLGILFGTAEEVNTLVSFEFNKEAIQQIFEYHITSMINAYGKSYALVFVSILVAIMFLLKNTFIYFANYFMAPIRNGVIRNIRDNVFGKTLRLHL